MTDTLIIKGSRPVRTVLGVGDEERRDKQDALISIALITDTSIPGKTDKIEDAVNYRTITKRVLALAEQSNYRLIERFAEEIAARCWKIRSDGRARDGRKTRRAALRPFGVRDDRAGAYGWLTIPPGWRWDPTSVRRKISPGPWPCSRSGFRTWRFPPPGNLRRRTARTSRII